MKTPIYIERGGRRYRIVTGSADCTKCCTFARRDSGREKCERDCYLPSWFTRLDLSVASLVEVGENRGKRIGKCKQEF